MKAFGIRPVSAWLVVCAVALWFTGCGKSDQPPARPAGSAGVANPLVLTGEPAQRGGRLTLLSAGMPQTFNPLLGADGASDQVIRLIFAGLVSLDHGTQATRPALAESWTNSPDGLTWEFTLRAGLRWSDGLPLTAADVVFTWNEIMYNPDMNPQTYELFRVDGKNFAVTQLDELTVRVVTPRPFAPFLEFFGVVPILPKHAIGREVQERRFLSVYTLNTRPERIIGSGPFRLKEYTPGKSVLLERNPEYWAVDGQGTRLPYLDEVLILTTGVARPSGVFLAGQGDLCEQTRPEEFFVLQAAATNGMRVLDLGVGAERDFLWFNQNTNVSKFGQPLVSPARSAWFRDQRFRQAISCGIDRARIAQLAYGGRAAPALTFVSGENQKWNNPHVPLFGFDRSRAQALLAEMGFKDRNNDGSLDDANGQAVAFTLLSNKGNPFRERTAQLIVEDLARLGITLQFQAVEFSALVARINDTYDYECALMGLGGGGLDPASQVNVLKSTDPLHQWFPSQKQPATQWEAQMDFLTDAQMGTLELATRKKYYDEIQMILAEQLPMICTVSPFHFAVKRVELVNLKPSVFTPYRLTWNVEQLALRKP